MARPKRCSECGGSGTVPDPNPKEREKGRVVVCPRCGGSGLE